MVNSTIHVHYGKFFALSALFTVSTSIAQVRGVVMMAPQSTKNIICFSSDERLDFDDRLIPQPYNISSPIVAVPKYKMYIGDYTETWTHAWQYQSENVSVFAYQAHRETMEDRFVIDENIGDTGVSLYAVFDGLDGNFTVDYLAYGFMDKLRNKIINIKKAKQGDTSNTYTYPNGSINYNKVLHDEVLEADRYLSSICESRTRADYKNFMSPNHCISASTAIIAVIDGDYLFVANVGDSYAVMCDMGGNATSLVKEHDFERNSKEMARAKEVSIPKGRHEPPLTGLSRIIGCFGTRNEYPFYVISDPEVFTYDLSKCKCKFIVLASDGIYKSIIRADRYTMDEADEPIVTYLNKHIETNLFEAMANLTWHMYSRFYDADDNKTIMVVKTNIRNT